MGESKWKSKFELHQNLNLSLDKPKVKSYRFRWIKAEIQGCKNQKAVVNESLIRFDEQTKKHQFGDVLCNFLCKLKSNNLKSMLHWSFKKFVVKGSFPLALNTHFS